MEKTSNVIKKWFRTSSNIKQEFQTSATLMERAGTGGALFRALYRDFLKESAEILNMEQLNSAYLDFKEIASLWTDVSALFHKIGETKDETYVKEASGIFIELSCFILKKNHISR